MKKVKRFITVTGVGKIFVTGYLADMDSMFAEMKRNDRDSYANIFTYSANEMIIGHSANNKPAIISRRRLPVRDRDDFKTVITKKWLKDGILHNEYGPALTVKDKEERKVKTRQWYINGKLLSLKSLDKELKEEDVLDLILQKDEHFVFYKKEYMTIHSLIKNNFPKYEMLLL